MSRIVKVWLSLLLTLLLAYTGYSAVRIYRAQQDAAASAPSAHIERTRAIGKLAESKLVDTAGKPFALDEYQGKVWLASFFFSSCPGPCAQMNRTIAAMQKDIPAEDFKFVSITVDPANDTPEVLAKYSRTLLADPARWSFLSGPFTEVERLGSEVFQVPVGPKMHTERVILVDKWANVRGLYLTSDPTQMLSLKRKIKDLLSETTPPTPEQKSTVTVEGAEPAVDAPVTVVPVADESSAAAAPAETATNPAETPQGTAEKSAEVQP